ncbi:hypothetical protein ES703_106421 [subsurface metagenome]
MNGVANKISDIDVAGFRVNFEAIGAFHSLPLCKDRLRSDLAIFIEGNLNYTSLAKVTDKHITICVKAHAVSADAPMGIVRQEGGNKVLIPAARKQFYRLSCKL